MNKKLKTLLQEPILIQVNDLDGELLGYCEWTGEKLVSLDDNEYKLDLKVHKQIYKENDVGEKYMIIFTGDTIFSEKM